jgi:biotin operon repressor
LEMKHRNDALRHRIAIIDELIRTGRGRTLAALAQELGVTERTVCRDLDHMKEDLGLPIIHKSGLGYAYSAPFPEWLVSNTREAPSMVEKPFSSADADRLRCNLEKIHGALYSKQKLLLRQQTKNGLPSSGFLVVHPYFLAKRVGELLLFGYRPEGGALFNEPIRLYPEVLVLPDTFEESPVVGGRISSWPFWLPGGQGHLVRLRFAAWAHWAADLHLADGQVMERRRGQTRVTFRTDNLQAVCRLVAFLGRPVRVEEPLLLRSMVRSDQRHPHKPAPQDGE